MDYPVFADPKKGSYQAFGMKRATLGMLDPRILANGARAARAGHKQTAVRGDPLQNGGVVVLDADGVVKHIHVERRSGDLADLDAVIAALR